MVDVVKNYLNKEEDKMTKSLAMISGGLDSILAAKLIKEQGIDVLGICFRSYFLMSKVQLNGKTNRYTIIGC